MGAVAALLLGGASPANAQAEKILRPSVYAKVTLTALGYMRDPKAFFRGGKFNLLLVHSGERASETQADDLANAFRAQGRTKKIGKTVRVAKISVYEYTNAQDLAKKLKAGGYNCVYVATGLRGDLAEVLQVARAGRALSIARRTSYVKAGAAFAVVQLGAKPRIVINAKAAKREGVRFDNRLLSRSTVVDR